MDTTAQPPQNYQSAVTSSQEPAPDSYADAYVPPASSPAQASSLEPAAGPMTPPSVQPAPQDTLSDFSAPTAPPVQPTQEATATQSQPSEDLADQNIFEMLGVTTGSPEQREQFLDELQQVIWDDFIEHDAKLLLTEVEQGELAQIMQSAPAKSLEQQEKVVVFLEKLIPDLEDIMLEKALQLKEEMARERLRALRELHRNDPNKNSVIERAEQQMASKQWYTATQTLNSLQ